MTSCVVCRRHRLSRRGGREKRIAHHSLRFEERSRETMSEIANRNCFFRHRSETASSVTAPKPEFGSILPPPSSCSRDPNPWRDWWLAPAATSSATRMVSDSGRVLHGKVFTFIFSFPCLCISIACASLSGPSALVPYRL